MSHVDQVTVTYIAVGIIVGLLSWLATDKRTGGTLIVSLVASIGGAFGVEILVANIFGVYATFGSLETLIGTSIVKSATGAILTVVLVRLLLHAVRGRDERASG